MIVRSIIRRLNTSIKNVEKEKIAEHVQQLINNHQVMVFSKRSCPFCIKVKNILEKYSIKDYKVLELDEIDRADEYQRVLGELTHVRTVPRVFINGKCIGGGDDTERLDQQGQLKRTLKEIGAID